MTPRQPMATGEWTRSAECVALLLDALDSAVKVLVADDNLLSIVDRHYNGTPECIEEWRQLVESIRSRS